MVQIILITRVILRLSLSVKVSSSTFSSRKASSQLPSASHSNTLNEWFSFPFSSTESCQGRCFRVNLPFLSWRIYERRVQVSRRFSRRGTTCHGQTAKVISRWLRVEDTKLSSPIFAPLQKPASSSRPRLTIRSSTLHPRNFRRTVPNRATVSMVAINIVILLGYGI